MSVPMIIAPFLPFMKGTSAAIGEKLVVVKAFDITTLCTNLPQGTKAQVRLVAPKINAAPTACELVTARASSQYNIAGGLSSSRSTKSLGSEIIDFSDFCNKYLGIDPGALSNFILTNC